MTDESPETVRAGRQRDLDREQSIADPEQSIADRDQVDAYDDQKVKDERRRRSIDATRG